MSHEDWRAVIDVHLNGSFNVSKAATPYFREQQSGSFVHFTSTSGLIGNIGQANYSAAKLGIVGLSQSIALDMARAGVRSNCIAPFAWSRMTASIPITGEGAEERVKRLQSMSADKIAPLVAYLASDAAKDVTNQIFAVRKNEIVLFSKPRPVRSMARSDGWTAQAIADELIPAFRADFARGDEVSAHVFPYDPI
jgi:NAD(P)-dependent dehydrogenase (short-subunit alcohol dehydrogenase family)